MPQYRFLVFTNAKDGREAEFNDWYSNRHVHDTLKVPGIVAAQRFELTSGEFPWRYLAIYELETEDPKAVVEDVFSRMGTDDMVMTEAAGDDAAAFVVKPLTERVTADK